jgi:uncharacterized protein
VAAERKAIEAERVENEAALKSLVAERAAIVKQISPHVASTFEKVARIRGGQAMARAERERCVVCQVRLRPMVFQAVVRNDEIVQCDTCQRILYFVPPAAGEDSAATDSVQPPAAPGHS